MFNLFRKQANDRAAAHDAGDDEHARRSPHYTAVYRVWHAGIEIGQTEQFKGSADMTAQLWDRRTHTNEAIGVFASHKAAEKRSSLSGRSGTPLQPKPPARAGHVQATAPDRMVGNHQRRRKYGAHRRR